MNILTDALAMEIIRLGSVRKANPISIGERPASPNGDKKGGHIFGRLIPTCGWTVQENNESNFRIYSFISK